MQLTDVQKTTGFPGLLRISLSSDSDIHSDDVREIYREITMGHVVLLRLLDKPWMTPSSYTAAIKITCPFWPVHWYIPNLSLGCKKKLPRLLSGNEVIKNIKLIHLLVLSHHIISYPTHPTRWSHHFRLECQPGIDTFFFASLPGKLTVGLIKYWVNLNVSAYGTPK